MRRTKLHFNLYLGTVSLFSLIPQHLTAYTPRSQVLNVDTKTPPPSYR